MFFGWPTPGTSGCETPLKLSIERARAAANRSGAAAERRDVNLDRRLSMGKDTG